MNFNCLGATGQIKGCPTPQMFEKCLRLAEEAGSHFFAHVVFTDSKKDEKTEIRVVSVSVDNTTGLTKVEAIVLDPITGSPALILINIKADMTSDSETGSIGHVRVVDFVQEKRLTLTKYEPAPLLEASM